MAYEPIIDRVVQIQPDGTVIRYVKGNIDSTDPKPMAGIAVSSELFERDTGKKYYFTEKGKWVVPDDFEGTDLGITGASVGDYVKVKSVDKDGKPTKWESGDPVSTEVIAEATDEWLEENISQETGYVLDRNLELENAAAPADLVGDLKTTITQIVPIKHEITFTSGGYIKTNINAGESVTLTPISDQSWSYAVVSCTVGDVFELNIEGANTARAWTFLTSGDAMIEKSDSGAVNGKITAPTNAAKLVLNNRMANGHAYTLDGTDAFAELQDDVEAITADVASVKSSDTYIYSGLSSISSLKWEQGTIDGNGADSPSNSRIRTVGYYDFTDDIIAKCDDGYEVSIVLYNYDGENYTHVGSIAVWETEVATVRRAYAGNAIRFALRVAGSSSINIKPEEYAHLHIYGYNRSIDDFFDNPNFKNVCHRGFNTIAPENTFPAFNLARNLGFKYVETDVQFTSDNVPVLLHDRSIDRTSNGTGNIDSMTYEEVLTYDFGSWKNALYTGTKIPTFENFIVWCKRSGVKPYIEIKADVTVTEAQVQALIDIVKKYNMQSACTWESFSSTLLGYVHAYDANARLGYLVTDSISASDISTVSGLRSDNEVFLLCYSSSRSFDDSTLTLAINANIPTEICIMDTNTNFANLNPIYSGNVTNGYPTNRKLYELANTMS